MPNNLLLVIALLVGFVLGYLLGRGGIEPQVVPPGPKPLSIKHSNGVVTVKVAAQPVDGRRFLSSGVNCFLVGKSLPFGPTELPISPEHVAKMNGELRAGAVPHHELEITGVANWPFKDGEEIEVWPLVLYGKDGEWPKPVGDPVKLVMGKVD